jgi:cysteine desulfurase
VRRVLRRRLVPGAFVIHLDHNAGTPVAAAVAAAMHPWLGAAQANASSAHARGQAARAAVEEARVAVSELAGCRPDEVIFTGSGSEADATALVGGALARREVGCRVVISAIEHEAVLTSGDLLATLGFDVVRVPALANGIVDADRFIAAATEGTAIAALMLASNETGVIQPVAPVARTLGARGIPLLTDVVQAVGKIPFSRDDLGADFLALSAHKFGGPQGVGALIVRRGARFLPLIGGAQEGGRRGGTEAVAAIAGLGAAAALVPSRMAAMPAVGTLRARFESGLRARFPSAVVHGADAPRLPNTLAIAFPGLDAAALVLGLDLAGVAVSRGSACHSGAEGASHVLAAMGVRDDVARGTLRISLGPETGAADIERALELVSATVARAEAAVASR